MPAGRHARRDAEPGDADDLAEEWVAGMTEDPQDEADEPVASGPWDSAEAFPAADRVDLGSLQVPVLPDQQIHLELTDDQNHIIAVSVTTDSGKLQMRALAAPKTAGLWADDRLEIAAAVGQAGGRSQEAEGPFGTELLVSEPPVPGSGQTEPQPARFIGVDGPRWMLTAKISGPAATEPRLAKPLEEVIAGLVVVRGDHPMPPRDLLEIQLPPEMRQAIADQIAAAEADQGGQGGQGGEQLNPFERGPEITETR